MKKAMICAPMCAPLLFAAAVLGLSVGCTPKTVSAPSAAPANANPFVGDWEGTNKRGEIYSFNFTEREWESYFERGGVRLPFYKGTYTYRGNRVDLRVTAEVDRATMKWVPTTSVLPPMTGRLSGESLKIGTLTDAELVKQ
jgi:hypothetical protein